MRTRTALLLLTVVIGIAFVGLVWAGEQAKPPAAPKGDAKAGKAVYEKSCLMCHAKDGTGNKAMSVPAFSDPKVIKAHPTAEKWVKAITDGVKGKVMPMQAYKGKLKPEEIANAAAYAWKFRTPKQQ